jgi:hypothetical protein
MIQQSLSYSTGNNFLWVFTGKKWEVRGLSHLSVTAQLTNAKSDILNLDCPQSPLSHQAMHFLQRCHIACNLLDHH